jgi:regulator of protease activity HflC (stomatin/prohibitin superfamily)
MNNYTFALIVIAVVALYIMVRAILKLHHAFIVPTGYAGLLYRHGKFLELLPPGRHVCWGLGFTIDPTDTRQTSLPIASQEVLTADNVSVKFALLVTYQVKDAMKAAHETQNWQTDLYNAAQLALRTVASGITAEALLTQRLQLAPQLLALVLPTAEKIGLSVHVVEVKDVMLPADLKRAFADTLKAKYEGQAALERARGESAALRNLANAARVLEGNPALMNLRVLQSLTSAQNAGNTLVLGMPAGFVPLKNGKVAPAPGDTNET